LRTTIQAHHSAKQERNRIRRAALNAIIDKYEPARDDSTSLVSPTMATSPVPADRPDLITRAHALGARTAPPEHYRARRTTVDINTDQYELAKRDNTFVSPTMATSPVPANRPDLIARAQTLGNRAITPKPTTAHTSNIENNDQINPLK
jgi:hypothetical protein